MNVRENMPLSDFSNYAIGGNARFFSEPESIGEILELRSWIRRKKTKFFILGGGTNILISDRGYSGIVIHPKIFGLRSRGNNVTVGSSVLLSELLDFCAVKEAAGLEWAGGLPGTVGGAVRGNAGAFGGETKDSVKRVESVSMATGETKWRSREECGFGYRSSVYKTSARDEIITRVEFELKRGRRADIEKSARDKMEYRRLRHPLEYPNIGSIFKNIAVKDAPPALEKQCKMVIKNDPFPVIPVAYLIAQAGLKGVISGGAMISPKHPNFIVNVLGAKEADVKKLIVLVKKKIKKNFSVEIEEEVIKLK